MQDLIITNAGRQLMTKTLTGASTMTLTKICTSDLDHSGFNVEELAYLDSINQQAPVTKVSRTEQGAVIVLATVDNTELDTGYHVRTLGLWAKDSNNDEILYAVSTEPYNPDYMPAFGGKTVSSITYRLNTKVSNSENVTLEINHGGGYDSEAVDELNDRVDKLKIELDNVEIAVDTNRNNFVKFEKYVDNGLVHIDDKINEHTPKTIYDKDGIHGIRFVDGKLQIQKEEGWDEDVDVEDKDAWDDVVKSYSVFGVSVNLLNSSPTSAVTYTDDAVGLTVNSSDWDTQPIFKDIKPCVFKNGKVVYYLDPNDFTKKADGSTAVITGADGDVMIEFPKIGLSITTANNMMNIKITDNPNDPKFNYYAHSRAKEGDRDKLYIGAYDGYVSGNKLLSRSGITATIGKTIGDFRTLANNVGTGYDILSFYPLTLLQALFIIKFKSLNSRTALGAGYYSRSYTASGSYNYYTYTLPTTGTTNTYGMYGGNTISNIPVKCFGIENLWGSSYHFIDGVYSDSNYIIKTAFSGFNDTGAGYINTGSKTRTTNVSGYISKVLGTTSRGFIPEEAAGSSTTYYSDNGYHGKELLLFFGGWGYGLFNMLLSACSTTTVTNASTLSTIYTNYGIGARLMYL